MRNSFFLLLAVACVFTQVQAEESVDTSRDLSGFYVGLDLSHDWSTARNYSDFGVAKIKGQDDEAKYDGKAKPEHLGFSKYKRAKVDPVVSLGYSHKFSNNFLVGVSAEVAFGKSKSGKNDKFISLQEEGKVKGCSYALKVKGGYYLSGLKASVYGTAGLKWKKADFRAEKDGEDLGAITSGKTMPVLGVGVEKKLAEKLSCSLEYEYFWKRSNPVYQAADLETDGETIEYIKQFCKSSLHGHSVRIGLKYYLF